MSLLRELAKLTALLDELAAGQMPEPEFPDVLEADGLSLFWSRGCCRGSEARNRELCGEPPALSDADTDEHERAEG